MSLHKTLSTENIREFQILYQTDPLESLLSVLDDPMAHVIKSQDQVLAICGVNDGQLWTVFSKDIKKHWRTFVKASPKLINFYHQFYDELWCEVWTENTFIHNWLVHLGFDIQYVVDYSNGQQALRFVRCKHWGNEFDSGPSRPVIH